jgi:hypothetical protein
MAILMSKNNKKEVALEEKNQEQLITKLGNTIIKQTKDHVSIVVH